MNNRIILTLIILTAALIAMGSVAAATNSAVDHSGNQIVKTNSTSVEQVQNPIVKTATKDVKAVEKAPAKKVTPKKPVQTKKLNKIQNKKYGKETVSSVLSLYGTHNKNVISMATGLAPKEVTKIIKDIKLGKYGNATKKIIAKKDKRSYDKSMASCVAESYGKKPICAIGMATGLAPNEVTKMIKDIKLGKYGTVLQKSILKKGQNNKIIKKATAVESLYGTHNKNVIAMATGLTTTQVTKIIKDIKLGKYGATLKKSILKKDKIAQNKEAAAGVVSLYGTHNINVISMSTGLNPNQVVKMVKDIESGLYGKSLQKSLEIKMNSL